MEETSTDRHWLHDRLREIEGEDSGFTVVNSPLRPVVERGDPWKVDVRHHELKAFLEPLAPDVVERMEWEPVRKLATSMLDESLGS